MVVTLFVCQQLISKLADLELQTGMNLNWTPLACHFFEFQAAKSGIQRSCLLIVKYRCLQI